MHKGFMKLIVGGTLAVVVALIVAGTASARMVYPASEQAQTSGDTSSLVGYPRGVVGAPGLETAQSTPVSQHAQKLTSGSSYGSFPEVVRTMNLGKSTPATSNGFDWNDAGIGVGIAAGVLSIIAVLAVGIRRSNATPATA
jgi:hypothetical protein